MNLDSSFKLRHAASWFGFPAWFLALAFLASVVLKLFLIPVGAPHVTIDDHTAYEGGFLIWFGHTPPQRMYLESWLTGMASILTWLAKQALSGHMPWTLGMDIVPRAFADYYNAPDLYVRVWRCVMLAMDMTSALLVFLTARLVMPRRHGVWPPVLAAVMFLFSYNTVWCNLVARPDTLVTLFAAAGLYLYYRSGMGIEREWLWGSAICLGMAAGMKLHGAFFAIFLVLDLLRINGIKKGAPLALGVAGISFVMFGFSAGSFFVDPLLYVKLRLLNHQDDLSPWIQWGEQWMVMLKGTGYGVLPLVAAAAAIRKNKGGPGRDVGMASILFQCFCWVMLFAFIRQLRAYWMLPVLPLFYMGAVHGVFEISTSRYVRALLVVPLLVVLMGQSVWQARLFHSVPYGELRQWVRSHVASETPFMILGYDAVALPRNTRCLNTISAAIRYRQAQSDDLNVSYTRRHVTFWEERSRLALYDMLNFKNPGGWEYYAFNDMTYDMVDRLAGLERISFIVVQNHFDMNRAPEWQALMDTAFSRVGRFTGPGGGGRGLTCMLYQRRSETVIEN